VDTAEFHVLSRKIWPEIWPLKFRTLRPHTPRRGLLLPLLDSRSRIVIDRRSEACSTATTFSSIYNTRESCPPAMISFYFFGIFSQVLMLAGLVWHPYARRTCLASLCSQDLFGIPISQVPMLAGLVWHPYLPRPMLAGLVWHPCLSSPYARKRFWHPYLPRPYARQYPCFNLASPRSAATTLSFPLFSPSLWHTFRLKFTDSKMSRGGGRDGGTRVYVGNVSS
jgi:hypothetical protein